MTRIDYNAGYTCVMASNQIPEPLQCKNVFNRYLSNGRSNPKMSKNEVHFFKILVLGGPSPPSQLVPNPFNWSPNQVYFSKVYLSKVYSCKMYPTCVSSKLCEFIPSVSNVKSVSAPLASTATLRSQGLFFATLPHSLTLPCCKLS